MMRVLFVGFFILWVQFFSSAQGTFSSTVHPFHIFLNSGFGDGNRFFYTGIKTNNGDDVNISTAGGIRPEFGVSYTFKNKIDVGISILGQTTNSYPLISNGSGFFDRFYVNLSGRYFISFTKRGNQHLNIGGSIPYLLYGTMLFDFSKIPGRNLEEFNYKKTFGGAVLTEYEIETRNRHWAFGAGFEYLIIHYQIESIRINYQKEPLSYWGLNMPLYDFQGNSISLYVRLGYRFGKIN